MHAYLNPGPFQYICLGALAVLVVCALLLWLWVPRIRGWGQLGVIYLLLIVIAVAVVAVFISGGAWWLLV